MEVYNPNLSSSICCLPSTFDRLSCKDLRLSHSPNSLLLKYKTKNLDRSLLLLLRIFRSLLLAGLALANELGI